jgi:hypothetical protein
MTVSDMQKTCFEVYRTPEGEFRAFLQAENPRRGRTEHIVHSPAKSGQKEQAGDQQKR